MSTILYLVNDATQLSPIKTTTALIHATAARGHQTWIAGCRDLFTGDAGPHARARRVEGPERIGEPATLALTNDLTIMVRTNPATGLPPMLWSHALWVLTEAEQRGATVLNPPGALGRFATKAGLLLLPEAVRPPTVLFAELNSAVDHARQLDRAVIKPVAGSQGAGVFITRADDPNLRTAVQLLLQQSPIIVQPWVLGAEHGDTRLFLIDGVPLHIEGVPMAVSRRPTGQELRSNVHLGAKASLSELTPDLASIAEQVGPTLRAHGLRIAGLDCIGDKIIEVNACSPGGLTDMGRLAGIDAVGGFLDQVLP